MLSFVFTDNNLPSMNGIEIIKIIRQFYSSKDLKIKIVMVSGEVGQHF